MSDKKTLLKEYNFFKTKLDELIKTNPNEFALVENQEIRKIFKNQTEALDYVAEHKIESGTFLVQQITKDMQHISRLSA